MSLSNIKSIDSYNRAAQKVFANELVDEHLTYNTYEHDYDCWDGDPPGLSLSDLAKGRLFELLAKMQLRSAKYIIEDYWYYFW